MSGGDPGPADASAATAPRGTRRLPGSIDEIAGRRATVMGLGLFGGGAGVARFLARAGARVTVTDLRDAETLRESVRSLEGVHVEWRLGRHDDRDFRDADLVVVNPAVREDAPQLRLARDAGVPLDTEIHLFLRLCRGRVAGVTGSKGKTTTAALLAHLVRADGGRVFLGGNIGGSLLESLDEIGPTDLVVLELSSFQLAWMAAARRSPSLALVTCLFPEHLDRHGTYSAYVEAKAQILAHQGPGDLALLNRDDPRSEPLRDLVRGRLVEFGLVTERGERWLASFEARTDSSDAHGRRLAAARLASHAGLHFLRNAAGAAAAAHALGIPLETIERALPTFPGVEHRQEILGRTVRGVLLVDDGASTTPESTAAALEAFGPRLLLLAGGSEKGADVAPLAAAIAAHCRAGAFYGAAGPQLARLVSSFDVSGEPHSEVASSANPKRPVGPRAEITVSATLEEGLEHLLRRAGAGDTVLFSPAFASFDQYRNYRDRAAAFRAAVARLAGPLRAIDRRSDDSDAESTVRRPSSPHA